MAQTFGRDEIRRMGEYWYEENWYSTRVTLASGTSSIFPQATGWNPNPSPSLMVTLEDVATPQDPYLELVATADRFSRILYAAQHRPRLEPVALHMRAVSSLSLVATPNGGAITDDPVVYRVSVLKLPITWKVMLGYPITALESEIAKEVGISTSPVAQAGTSPIPISSVIERTYYNRQTQTPTEYDGPAVSPTPQSPVTLPIVQAANENELLVVRNVAIEADEGYGVQVQIERDADPQHTVIDASTVSLDRGADLFVPAKDYVQVTVSTQRALPGPIPVRLTVWHVSLSDILRVRLGLLDLQGLQSLFTEGARTPEQEKALLDAATRLYDRTLAGVA